MKPIKGVLVAMLAGTIMLAAPAFAESHGGGRGAGGFSRGGGGQRSSGNSFNAPARGFNAPARTFNAPARGFSGGGRDFDNRGFEYRGYEHRGFDRDYVRRGGWGVGVGVYPQYGYPYGYAEPYYDPSYAAPPYYAAPAPAPACNPNSGYYDANGNWIPDPNCAVSPEATPAPYGYGY